MEVASVNVLFNFSDLNTVILPLAKKQSFKLLAQRVFSYIFSPKIEQARCACQRNSTLQNNVSEGAQKKIGTMGDLFSRFLGSRNTGWDKIIRQFLLSHKK